MKKHFLLFTLCFFASYQLGAMDNNADQGEMARRQRQTEATANLIRAVAFTGGSFVAHHYFDHFIASLQGWKKLLGNFAWLGTATLTTFVTTNAVDTFARTMYGTLHPANAGWFEATGISFSWIFIPFVFSIQKRAISEKLTFSEFMYSTEAGRDRFFKLSSGFLLPIACAALFSHKLNYGFFAPDIWL